MKENMTLTTAQENAVNAILCARTQGNRAAAAGMTLLNKSPRVLRGIRKSYERQAARFGFQPEQISAQWQDVKDMAQLEATSNE